MKERVAIQTLRSFAEIETARNAWTSWQTYPNSDIEYYSMILNARPEIIRPHVLVVHRDDVVDALLVGRLEQVSVTLNIGYASLLNVRVRRLTFIHGGFLGNTSPENSEALVSGILRSLKQGEAGMALVSHLRTDCPLFEAAKRVPSCWSRDYASQTQPHRSMQVPATIDELYQRFSGKVRKNLKWQAKKLLSEFPAQVRIGCFSELAHVDKMFRDIEEVAKTSYQRGLGVGFEDSPEMRNRMNLAAEKKWLQAHVLYIAEKPCAFWVGTVYRGIFHSNFMGYDKSFSKYSPGMFLLLKVIEELCERENENRVREIDFGLGDAQYKEILSDREWKEGSVSIFAPSWAGARLNLMLTPPAIVDQLVKNALGRMGLLQRIKAGWRSRLAQK